MIFRVLRMARAREGAGMDFKELFASLSNWLFTFAIACAVGVWWASLTPMTTNLSLAVAVVAIALAVFFHPLLGSQHLVVRVMWTLGAGCAAGLLAYYTLWIDLSKAVVETAILASNAKQPPNTMIGGMQWQDSFTELSVMLSNPTKWDYENLDVEIIPDKPVIAAQIGSPAIEASLWRIGTAPIYSLTQGMPDGTEQKVDLVPIASEFGYRLRVPLIPKESFVVVRMAIAGLKPFSGKKNTTNDLGFSKPYYVQRLKYTNGQSIWYGHAERPASVFIPAKPRKVEIQGSFEVLKAKKDVKQEVPIGRN